MTPPDTQDANGKTGREVILSAHDICVSFGKNVVLDHLDLDIYRGEILGFVGASGAGKSVLMRSILRLIPRQNGVIRILGEDYDKVDEAKKIELDMRLGVLFQQGALFSSLTVRENIQVPMREYLDLPQQLMDELAELKVAMVGLAPDAVDKYPSELSGGQQQRIGVLRALAASPPIVLMDEPFGALDALNRSNLQQWLVQMWEREQQSVVMVTHDVDEAVFLADRVIVLSARPGTVIHEERINLPRPRTRAMLTSNTFLAHRAVLLDALGLLDGDVA